MKFTNEEMRQALEDIQKEYPAVHKWFFVYQVEKNREKDALRNQTTPREAG
jgi:hypothetical protein